MTSEQPDSFSQPDSLDAEISRRLRSASGHLQAVIAMFEANEPCEDVLHQLGAVQAALGCAGRMMILCQLQQSASTLVYNSSPEARLETVTKLSKLFSLFNQTRSYR